MSSTDLSDPVDFQWVFETHQNIHGSGEYPEYKLSTLQNIVYIEKENAVLATSSTSPGGGAGQGGL